MTRTEAYEYIRTKLSTHIIIDDIFNSLDNQTCTTCAHNLVNVGKPKGCTRVEINPIDMQNTFSCSYYTKTTKDN